MQNPSENPGDVLAGAWTYRSFLNDADPTLSFDELEFGQGTLILEPGPANVLGGTIGGPGWQLKLQGSIAYGNPYSVWFQGKGVVSGAEWIYSYVGYLSPHWPNGVDQVPALVGTIVRDIPHPSGNGGVSPAGVVASWIAVKRDPEP